MALDISKAALQIQLAEPLLVEQYSTRARAIEQAVTAVSAVEPDEISGRYSDTVTWLVADVDGPMHQVHPPGPLPSEHMVISIDGSHIDVDRHAPFRSFLINIGTVAIRYGNLADANLSSFPWLATAPDTMTLRDGASNRTQPIEGPLLGMLRAVMEIEALADAVDMAPATVPVLCLLDGSLILWGLSGGAYPDYVRTELLRNRLIPAMRRLEDHASRRTLAVASYISDPRSADVINALRISHSVCKWKEVNCDQHCGFLSKGERNCDSVDDVTDADLFNTLLNDGERSKVYRTRSSIVADHYQDQRVGFWYLNAGTEIARIEMPAWVTENGIDFAHACLLDQNTKGLGYPLALQEAHEQAVVTGSDRRVFEHLMLDALKRQRVSEASSEKARSKRTRFI